jgi:uncharacterized protein with NRDE domain
VCTLAVAWRVFEDAPVVVAANRDEALDRSSVRPEIAWHDPNVLAPRDARAGGTWIGVNEHDVVVGLTNRWTDVDRDGERSRGLLVRDALGESSARAAIDRVEERVRGASYEGFNLVVVDAESGAYVEYDDALRVQALDPGVHVVVNVGRVDDLAIPSARREHAIEQAGNARRVDDALQVEPGETADDWRERAASVLADHEYGVCVHGDGYGTRSSSLLQVADTVDYWFADGPPCETTFDPVAAHLEGDI